MCLWGPPCSALSVKCVSCFPFLAICLNVNHTRNLNPKPRAETPIPQPAKTYTANRTPRNPQPQRIDPGPQTLNPTTQKPARNTQLMGLAFRTQHAPVCLVSLLRPVHCCGQLIFPAVLVSLNRGSVAEAVGVLSPPNKCTECAVVV